MSTHDFETDTAASRPKAARIEAEAPAPHVLRAAATGRADVLDASALLGIQRAVGNAGVGALLEEERSPVHDVIGSGRGTPLAPEVRSEMESRLGHDFGDVRVHTDSAAHESAKSVNAHAYTVGPNVVFQRDQYDPSGLAGKTMLAHELTHVVQQRSGPVDGTATAGGINVSDPGDRFEREASSNADRVMSAPMASPVAAAGPTAAGGSVQRHEDSGDGEAHVQGMFVQREDAPAEEEKPEEAAVQGMFVQREEEEEMEG